MRLPDLVRRAYPERAGEADALPDVPVSTVVQDARRVVPGAVFVARRGARVDAHRFAADAVAAGAILIVGARPDGRSLPLGGVPYLSVPNDRAAVARLAAAYHGAPSTRTRVLGVTGTDGKTTTAALMWWLLDDEAAPAALSSSAMTRFGRTHAPGEGRFTTPEASEVQAFLARAVDHGMARVVLESSSHGLALGRLDEVQYARAVWTNLAPEHLDFHGTLEAYRDAKISLIRRAGAAVLNRDDPHYPDFAAAADTHVSFGEDPRADWRLLSVAQPPGRLELRIAAPNGRTLEATVPLVGRFNAWNALAALAVAHAEGVPLPDATARLATFPGVPGRMQVVQAEPFTVVVDFAHTAPALARALEAVAPQQGRRIVVIGAAGERDPAKRGPLGAAAVAGADVVVLTEEDARSEAVADILDAMVEGARGAGGRPGDDVRVVPDRREAIRTAVALARPGDVVLLAGKGHEATLERADEVLPWDEASEARRALHDAGWG
ncbi:MAG: UDP-N-acetylmuramyl-tripeptide synthetase [Trueperaceae bacterium]|nr:UDP-N-acetylmuramyl-tripeptide synthetase [Trueperaceae bacterium]